MTLAGTILGGRYRLLERLGEGGMGEVWTAENISIRGAEVAVKVLHGTLARDPDAVRRFRAEAEATVRIRHPNIVRVHDFGESEEGAPYMVMERLRGESLAARLERDQSIPPAEAVQIVGTVLEALDAAHAMEILHRDLKPENIFLAEEGDAVQPKILDFGVAKFLGDDAERVRMTRTGALIGTPAYMSPEQSRGETAIDLRSDVWAMGVILYELLTGRLPYEASNYNAMLIRIATESHTPVRDLVPTLDPVLASIVERAMARRPRDRYASAGAMLTALRAYARGEGVLEEVSRPSELPVPMPRVSSFPTLEGADTLPGDSLAPLTPKLPSRVPMAALAAVALIAVAVAAATAMRSRSPSPDGSARPPTAFVAGHALTITGLPPGATVFVDDAAAALPAVLAAGADHRVRVEVPGRPAWMAVVPRPVADVQLAYAPPPAAAVGANDAGSEVAAGAPPSAPAAPSTTARRAPRRDAGRPSGGLLARDPGF